MEEFIINNPTLIIILLLWSLIWKGFALWKAAKREQISWFIVLLVVNTLGLLEFLYLFVFTRKISKEDEQNNKEELFENDNENV